MKAHLIYRDRDLELDAQLLRHQSAVIQDLDLGTLFAAMSQGDEFLTGIVKNVVMASEFDVETIRYRQAIVKDCLAQPAAVRAIYDLAGETLDKERRNFFSVSNHDPSLTLYRAVNVTTMLIEQLMALRRIADDCGSSFVSDGFATLLASLRRELDDAYFAEMREHLRRLKFPRGVLLSARLGAGNKGIDYVLRKENPPEGTWLSRLFEPGPQRYSYRLPERDENGARALSELQGEGLNLAANALAQSAEHIKNFFKTLRAELAFYIGCLNLHDVLTKQDTGICFPDPTPLGNRLLSADGLYDLCLALNLKRPVVGNAVRADGKDLVIITGANQGGKSTFLRSIGIAQIMMQCGMFVAARRIRADVVRGVFTHYKREEDKSMKSGKFDEELARMSEIVDELTTDVLVLFNESFAATNEREGSAIAQQIVTALIEAKTKICFVTHQYTFARDIHRKAETNIQFLRAEREPDGTRTFRIVEGEPQPTSHGEDLYRKVFDIEGARQVTS